MDTFEDRTKYYKLLCPRQTVIITLNLINIDVKYIILNYTFFTYLLEQLLVAFYNLTFLAGNRWKVQFNEVTDSLSGVFEPPVQSIVPAAKVNDLALCATTL